jgi:hypothetical protein
MRQQLAVYIRDEKQEQCIHPALALICILLSVELFLFRPFFSFLCARSSGVVVCCVRAEESLEKISVIVVGSSIMQPPRAAGET